MSNRARVSLSGKRCPAVKQAIGKSALEKKAFSRVFKNISYKEVEMTESATKTTEAKLANLMEDWKKLEDQTIAFSEELEKKSDNPFIKVIMEMVKHDSQKHKIMQQFVIDALTKKAVNLSPQELIPLADVLEKHIQAEARSMGMAHACSTESRNYFVDFIVSALTDDEIKHHNMLKTLDHIKSSVYPYGQTKPEHLTDAYR